MVFNPDKCEHIRIVNKRKIVQSTYKIHHDVFILFLTYTKSLPSHVHIVFTVRLCSRLGLALFQKVKMSTLLWGYTVCPEPVIWILKTFIHVIVALPLYIINL